MMNALQRLAYIRGTYIVNDSLTVTKNFCAIEVLQDTVFSSIKQGTTDIKDQLISDETATVKAGAIISKKDVVFSSVQLTSGSVLLVLE